MAENDVVVLDESAVGKNPLIRAELNAIIEEEQQRLHDYRARFHRNGPLDLRNKTVLLAG